MEKRPFSETKPWNKKNIGFILAFIALILFVIFTFVNLLYYITTAGINKEIIIPLVPFIGLLVILIIMPFRYQEFQKKRNFGLLNSQIFYISHKSNQIESYFNPNESMNKTDLKIRLENFFTLSENSGTVILDSKNIHKKKILSYLPFMVILFDIFVAAMIYSINFGPEVTFSLVIPVIFANIEVFLAFPHRESNYQIKITNNNLIFSLLLKNGKSKKLKSMTVSKVDYVTIEGFRSHFRLKVMNSQKSIIFPENYSLEQSETIYPLLGQFIDEVRNHTISL